MLVAAQAQEKQVAATPPMGWNSWDSYGLTITEDQFRANVAVLATVLKPFGWNYAVVDEGWFMDNPEDRPTPDKLRLRIDMYGRYIPVIARFPSAKPDDGFTQIGKDVHALGLHFGIHIVRGIPRSAVAANTPIEAGTFHAVEAADQADACPWDPTNWGVRDNPAGQAYYDSLLHQFAGWGVDLLKVDCISDHPYKVDEIRMIRRAIDKTGRPMVLSLSPGPTKLDHAAEVGELAQMWRISDDFWDVWKNDKEFPKGLLNQFERTAAWAKYAKPGNWPDADMLPIGHLGPHPGYGDERPTNFTPDEQKTLLTLWAMARSPMILGANLTQLDAPTRALLTNRDMVHVNQQSTASRVAKQDGDLIVWTADLPGTVHALALFNTADIPTTLDVDFARYGLGQAKLGGRNAWAGTTLAPSTKVKAVTIPPHGCILWILEPAGAPTTDLLGDSM